jgi:hypothetical protein
MVASMSTPFDGLAAGVSPADGAANRRTPERTVSAKRSSNYNAGSTVLDHTIAAALDCFSAGSDPI